MAQTGSVSRVGMDSAAANSADVMPVVARNLVKAYGDFIAVRGIDFMVRPGECFGFLGPNGAGKTSTMRMISCTSPVTSGELLVNGLPVQREPRTIKTGIGVVPQEDNLDEELSVLDNLRLYAGYFGIPRSEAVPRAMEALRSFKLADHAGAQVDELSGGMKRRLLIARGLINDPQLMILDEPTTGLDPQARHVVWRMLRSLKERGVTLLLTTHYLEEAAALCDRLLVMHEGKILSQGSPADLIRRHVGDTVIEVRSMDESVLAGAAGILRDRGAEIEETEDSVHAFGLSAADGVMDGVAGEQAVVRAGNLEDVFLRLTGRGLEE